MYFTGSTKSEFPSDQAIAESFQEVEYCMWYWSTLDGSYPAAPRSLISNSNKSEEETSGSFNDLMIKAGKSATLAKNIDPKTETIWQYMRDKHNNKRKRDHESSEGSSSSKDQKMDCNEDLNRQSSSSSELNPPWKKKKITKSDQLPIQNVSVSDNSNSNSHKPKNSLKEQCPTYKGAASETAAVASAATAVSSPHRTTKPKNSLSEQFPTWAKAKTSKIVFHTNGASR